jgi:glycosyltransferase involved in cell wall biosynthesis
LVERLDVDPTRIDIVPNGVSEAFFTERRDDEASSDAALPYVLFVGTFEARKGLDTLHGALSRINAAAHSVRLVLAGRPGWGTDELLERMLAEPWVEVVSDPSDHLLAELYRKALALVYPSRMEGFGLPVVVAMAAGCLVIATDLDCIREYARETPLYFPVADEAELARVVRLVLDAPDGAFRSRRAAGREAVGGLRWSASAELTARAIERSVE